MKSPRDYILFIDESGKSKLSDETDNFLLSGLIVDQDLHAALSGYMVSLKDKSKIPIDENIHAFDIFEGERRRIVDEDGRIVKNRDGTNKHKHIPFSSIAIFFKRLSSLIEGADMHSFILRQNKTKFNEMIVKTAQDNNVTSKPVFNYLGRKQLNDFLYEALARKMILEFGHFLELQNGHGQVIAESRRQEDEAVLRAFIAATHESTYMASSQYKSWAKSSFKRIHSLTFQNKKGLSFGLEIADLFGWAHFNKKYGRSFPIDSAAKNRRVENRLEKVDKMMKFLYKKNPEDITDKKLQRIAPDKVSEFTEALRAFRSRSVLSGTTPGNPGGP
jgi:hypothetical protein